MPSDRPSNSLARPVLVVVAEDDPVLRAGLEGLLKLEPGFACLGAVGTEAELSWVLAGAHPDVVLVDTVFGGADGLDACFELKQRDRPPAVLLYTVREDEAYVAAAVAAGADGIVPKDARAHELLEALRHAAAGRSDPLGELQVGDRLDPVAGTR